MEEYQALLWMDWQGRRERSRCLQIGSTFQMLVHLKVAAIKIWDDNRTGSRWTHHTPIKLGDEDRYRAHALRECNRLLMLHSGQQNNAASNGFFSMAIGSIIIIVGMQSWKCASRVVIPPSDSPC